jgi:hypothetical protein
VIPTSPEGWVALERDALKERNRELDVLTGNQDAQIAALRARVEQLEGAIRSEQEHGTTMYIERNSARARVELLELLASDVVDEFNGTIGPALVGAIKTLRAALTPKGGET